MNGKMRESWRNEKLLRLKLYWMDYANFCLKDEMFCLNFLFSIMHHPFTKQQLTFISATKICWLPFINKNQLSSHILLLWFHSSFMHERTYWKAHKSSCHVRCMNNMQCQFTIFLHFLFACKYFFPIINNFQFPFWERNRLKEFFYSFFSSWHWSQS